MVMHSCISLVSPPKLTLGPHRLQVVWWVKLLGVTVDYQMTRKQHVTITMTSAVCRLYMLHRFKSLGTLTDEFEAVYLTFILPKLMYASLMCLLSHLHSTTATGVCAEEDMQDHSWPCIHKLRPSSDNPEPHKTVYQTSKEPGETG
ncbi:hypothetical protein E2C01_065616 [Portunus trituberculatus]|uniref:Uncharacterized protein n=1 Tax=Portunus trituberculatus TaxID=210409 RepID=A0A5B7HG17_PORTR|nr:hypothetical protein [Portunus trituberculatus]